VLGRQHSGRKGDYLVESSDGVLRIAPRQIFEDIYVPFLAQPPVEPGIELAATLDPPATPPKKQQMWPPNQPSRPRQIPAALSLTPQLTRKFPQSERTRRNFASGINSL
jgi:hypothetical protein